MAKIFFGCSMRGGHNIVTREDLSKFPEIIEELGHELASKHQTKEGVIEEENKLTKNKIHDRDYKWAIESDIGIFEISNPSLGVGAEISDMIHLGKPVLCLFKKGLEDTVSAYVLGKKDSKYINTFFQCYAYESFEEVKEIIKAFIK